MSSNSNNYITPFYFTQPPPNYNLNNSWNYAWPALNHGSLQNTRSVAPPPPPPPYPPPSNSHVPPPVPPGNTVNSEQKPQNYYNSSPQRLYHSRRYNNNNAGHYNGGTAQYAATPGEYVHSPGQYVTSPTHYNSASVSYMNNNPPNYAKKYNNKRKHEYDIDPSQKSMKRKKKPLSKNIPQRKDWSVTDAKRALMVEKEYNKRYKSQSLIIKFPDLDLSRELVAKFNSAIQSVHFQQPSTPRFCFVTLNESADPEIVIQQLNKVPFGQGFLTAEYKRDRDDELNIGPEDIDPLTLYVGNLAQEVTKEDMVNMYPKQRRIDIGYAKKMKYTRYAFISFKTVDDSIQAFKKTHATQMYSKSLIVRFRRLNGTVGMPGEPKPQLPQRNEAGEQNSGGSHLNSSDERIDLNHHTSDTDTENTNTGYTNSRIAPWEMVDVSNWETNLKLVKDEPPEETDDDEENESKAAITDYMSPFMPGSLETAFSSHKPMIKVEVKKEKEDEYYSMSSSVGDESNDVSHHGNEVEPKLVQNSTDGESLIISPERIKKETNKTDDRNSYNSLISLNRKMKYTDFVPLKVKREMSPPAVDEISTDGEERIPSVNAKESVRVKSEPEDKGDDSDRGDEDDSSDSDDFNFNSMLSRIEDRKRKKLKKPNP